MLEEKQNISGHAAVEIGKYVVLREIAQGLATRVLKAKHSETGALAAIKMLNLNMVANQDVVDGHFSGFHWHTPPTIDRQEQR